MPVGVSLNNNRLKHMPWVPTVEGPRRPADSDVNYPIQTLWRVSACPQSGEEGEQWLLIGFTANGLAKWRQLAIDLEECRLSTLSVGDTTVNSDKSGNIRIVPDTSGGIRITPHVYGIGVSCAQASASIRGTASFDQDDFDIKDGHVSLSESSIVTNIGGARPRNGTVIVHTDAKLCVKPTDEGLYFSTSDTLLSSIETDSGTAHVEHRALTLSAIDPIRVSAVGSNVSVGFRGPLDVKYGGTGAGAIERGGVVIGNGAESVKTVPLSEKGDLIVGTEQGQPGRLSLSGCRGYVLAENQDALHGVEWIDPHVFQAESDLIKLSEVIADNADEIVWTEQTLRADMSHYILKIKDLVPEHTGADMMLVVNAEDCDQDASDYDSVLIVDDGNRYEADSYIPLTDCGGWGIGNSVDELGSYSGEFVIKRQNLRDQFSRLTGTASYLSAAGTHRLINVSSVYRAFYADISSICIALDNGRILKGIFEIYGVK